MSHVSQSPFGTMPDPSPVAPCPAHSRKMRGRFTSKAINDEVFDERSFQVRSSQGRSRLSANSGVDGDRIPAVWIPEMVRVRGQGADSLYQQWAAYFMDVSRVRHSGRQLVPGCDGMADLLASVLGILEQASGDPRSDRIMHYLRCDCD